MLYRAAMTGRPVLFLDVDGTLIPFGGSHGYGSAHANPLLARLDPALGPPLMALPCDLMWATTWMDEANEVIGPQLGLPALPVLDCPDSEEDDDRLHWKTRCLVDRAAGRPFVWVDDEISHLDRAWVTANHPGPALLHRVDQRHGLTVVDLVIIADWLARLPAS
jgi:hypothetical protein